MGQASFLLFPADAVLKASAHAIDALMARLSPRRRATPVAARPPLPAWLRTRQSTSRPSDPRQASLGFTDAGPSQCGIFDGETLSVSAKYCIAPSKVIARSSARSRLKIVRAFEPGVSPQCAGRMVISGRMADVCAELERMEQRQLTSSARLPSGNAHCV